MFLSKIWFVLVGLFAGVALTAAFVAPRPADRRIEQLEAQRLDRAQYAAEQMLKNDARRWIDWAAKLGRDANLTESLDSASRGVGEPRMIHETVKQRLKSLVPNLDDIGVESLVAVDAKGRVIARLGERENDHGDSVAGLEVVDDALRGYLSDDASGAGGRLQRLAAAPVLAKTRDRIVGALMVGTETGKRLAERWKQELGVEVAILLRRQVVSATITEALVAPLPDLIEQRREDIKKARRTHAIPLPAGSERLLAVAAPFAGAAADQDAFYVLLGKKSSASNPFLLLSSTTKDDLSWSHFPWLALAGTLIVILGVGLYLQRHEAEGPLARLRADVQKLARGEVQKLDDARFPGKFGGIARDVNAAMERFTHAPSPRSETAKKDIGAILDQGQGAPPSRTFDLSSSSPFGLTPPPFAPPSAPGSSSSLPALGNMPPASPFGALPPGPSSSPAMPPLATPGPLPRPPTGAPLPGRMPPAPLTSPPVPIAAPPARLAPPPSSSSLMSPDPVTAPTAPPPSSAHPPFSTEMEDEPTANMAGASDLEDPQTRALQVDAEEAHIREVFAEYVAARQRCGEPTSNLTLEKFRAKLDANRQQLVTKYGARTARFSVYVKDGKAAIKATPVRD